MSTNRVQLKSAVHTLLNDVVEQCFRHLIHHPQSSDELNRIIKDATDEINYLMLKIDAHNHRQGTPDLDKHYESISKDLHKKSLLLMGRLQKVQRGTISYQRND
ncbi:MAG: hypothetical protein KDC12_01570 [Flavobacteriales bacterium]|nr:hypothetical protein [Flavobacteriales bacterium]